MGFIVRAYQITERVGIFPAEQFCDFLGVNEKKKSLAKSLTAKLNKLRNLFLKIIGYCCTREISLSGNQTGSNRYHQPK